MTNQSPVPSAGNLQLPRHRRDRSDEHARLRGAIDLSTRYADYWLWKASKGKGAIAYHNQFPYEIVRIFEKHGFIWARRVPLSTPCTEYRPGFFAAGGMTGRSLLDAVRRSSNGARRQQPLN